MKTRYVLTAVALMMIVLCLLAADHARRSGAFGATRGTPCQRLDALVRAAYVKLEKVQADLNEHPEDLAAKVSEAEQTLDALDAEIRGSDFRAPELDHANEYAGAATRLRHELEAVRLEPDASGAARAAREKLVGALEAEATSFESLSDTCSDVD